MPEWWSRIGQQGGRRGEEGQMRRGAGGGGGKLAAQSMASCCKVDFMAVSAKLWLQGNAPMLHAYDFGQHSGAALRPGRQQSIGFRV